MSADTKTDAAVVIVFESPPTEKRILQIQLLVDPGQNLDPVIFGGKPNSSSEKVGGLLSQVAPVSATMGFVVAMAVALGLAIVDTLGMRAALGLLQTLGANQTDIKRATLTASVKVASFGCAVSLAVCSYCSVFMFGFLPQLAVPVDFIGLAFVVGVAGAVYVAARHVLTVNVLSKDPAAIHRGS